MTVDQLISNVNKKIPTILLLQAWADDLKDVDWKNDYKDGHYVTCIGFNNDSIFFEDPSSYVRTFLTFDELNDRWHDFADDNKSKISHVGIVITGKTVFQKNQIIHMD